MRLCGMRMVEKLRYVWLGRAKGREESSGIVDQPRSKEVVYQIKALNPLHNSR